MAKSDSTHQQLDNPKVDHETSDVNIRAILGFGGVLAVSAAIIHVVIWILFGYFDAREAKGAAPDYPLATAERSRLPPEPRLQVTPREDLRDLRAGEDQLLESYGWVDRNAGIVRIPIADAMKLTVQRGLPVREEASK